MPDKKYNELSDIGWESMATTLDSVMPVQKDRRWLLFLLLFMSMGFIAAGVVYWNSKIDTIEAFVEVGASEEQDDTTIKEGQKSDERLNESLKSHPLSHSSNEHSVTNQETIISNPNSSNEASLTVMEEDLIFKNDRKIDNEITLLESVEKQDALMFNEEQSTAPISIVERKVAMISNEEVLTDPEEIGRYALDNRSKSEFVPYDIKVQSYTMLESLISLKVLSPMGEVASNERVFNNPELLSYFRKQPINIRFYAGLALPYVSSSTGFFAGVGFEKQLFSRWKLEGGLNILKRLSNSNPLSARSNVAFDVTAPTSLTDMNELMDQQDVLFANDANEVLQEYYGLVSGKLSQSTYIEFPLELKYQLSRRHEIGSGFRYGYLLSAKNERIYLAEFESSLAAAAGYLNLSALSEANVINKHNLSLIGSYRFALTRRLGLLANLNIGLNNVIRTEGASDRNNRLNYIGFGIDYRLQM